MAKKQLGKMSFDKICRILANEWQEDFSPQKADQIATWVESLKSEVTRAKLPKQVRASMIDKVVEITKERRMEKFGDDYIENNDKDFLALSYYIKQKSEMFD